MRRQSFNHEMNRGGIRVDISHLNVSSPLMPLRLGELHVSKIIGRDR